MGSLTLVKKKQVSTKMADKGVIYFFSKIIFMKAPF